jgi:hypothetical protein
MLLRPFVVFKKELDPSFIMWDANKINGERLNSYHDSIIKYFLNKNNEKALNICISEIQEELSKIGEEFNILLANSISIKSLIELSEEEERLNGLIHYKLPQGMQTSEIEKILSENSNEIFNILGKHDNCFKDIINSKEGINKSQMSQMTINVGLKPDLEGNIYPLPVNSNFLTGLETPSDYMIDAAGARKACLI